MLVDAEGAATCDCVQCYYCVRVAGMVDAADTRPLACPKCKKPYEGVLYTPERFSPATAETTAGSDAPPPAAQKRTCAEFHTEIKPDRACSTCAQFHITTSTKNHDARNCPLKPATSAAAPAAKRQRTANDNVGESVRASNCVSYRGERLAVGVPLR